MIKNAYHVLVLNSKYAKYCVHELLQFGVQVDLKKLNQVKDTKKYHAIVGNPQLSHLHADLKCIGIPGHASKQIMDMNAATNLGIMVFNTSNEKNALSKEGELTISLLLNLVRNVIPSHFKCKQDGMVDREVYTGIEVEGKILGLVGMDEIGKRVAVLGKRLGMKVFGYDPTVSEEEARCIGVTKCSRIEECYAKSDFLSLHAPVTKQTKGMFDEGALGMCKKGVFVMVPSKMELVKDGVLETGLKNGTIKGAGIDVWHENCYRDLIQKYHVLTTFGVKNAVEESKIRAYKDMASTMYHALLEKQYDGVRNAVHMPYTTIPAMKPYMQLAEGIGKLIVLHAGRSMNSVGVVTTGGTEVDLTLPKVKNVVQAAVAKGMMTSLNTVPKDEQCNYVNATMHVLKNGIRTYIGEPSKQTDYLRNTICVQVEMENGHTFSIIGSVFGQDPRIVQIDKHHDFPAFQPKGTLLFLENQDQPGAIAPALQILSNANINVANLGLARQDSNRKALSILTLDTTPSSTCLHELEKLSTIESVKLAELGSF